MDLIILATMTKFEPVKRDMAHEGWTRWRSTRCLPRNLPERSFACVLLMFCHQYSNSVEVAFICFCQASILHAIMSSKRKWDDDANAPPPPASTDAAAQAGKPQKP
jgi:hypothetical protein